MGERWQQKYGRVAIDAAKSERWLAKYGPRFLDYDPNQPRDRRGRWTRVPGYKGRWATIAGYKTWLDPVSIMTNSELQTEWDKLEIRSAVLAGGDDDAAWARFDKTHPEVVARMEELNAEIVRRQNAMREAELEAPIREQEAAQRELERRQRERALLEQRYAADPRTIEELEAEQDYWNSIYINAPRHSTEETEAHQRMRVISQEVGTRRLIENMRQESQGNLEFALNQHNDPRVNEAAAKELDRRQAIVGPLHRRIGTEGLTPQIKDEILEASGSIPNDWGNFSSDTAQEIAAMGYSPRDLVKPYMATPFFENESDVLSNKYSISETWGDAITINIDANDGTRMERRFSMEGSDLVVEHALFKIPDHLQGNGTSKETLGYAMELYENLGVVRIDVHANINAGGYVWARYGFVPTDISWYDLRQQIAHKVPFTLTDDPKDIWKVADYDSKNGREILPHTDWYGFFDMADAESVERFNKKVRDR